MTNAMCGIEFSITRKKAHTESKMCRVPPAPRVCRVLPFQGGECFVGALTQGVALGWRVDAPLARRAVRAKGAKAISPGRRLGNQPTKAPGPERAKLGRAHAESRTPEQTIAGNVVELLEV